MAGDPPFGLAHILGNALIFVGFVPIAAAWGELHQAEQAGTLAMIGPYAVIRLPQYAGIILVMLGFLLQWLTLLTFPVLMVTDVRLAQTEEHEALASFGEFCAR